MPTLLRISGSFLVFLFWTALGSLPIAFGIHPLAVALWVVGLTGVFLWAHGFRGAGMPRLRRLARGRLRPPGAGMGRALAAVLPLIVAQMGLLLGMFYLGFRHPAPTGLMKFAERSWGWLAVLLAVVVMAPVMEEVAFRGWIQRRLERRWGVPAAVVVTAVVFALAHMQTVGLPNRLVLGIALGVVVVRTGSIWMGVVLHAACNLLVSLLSLLPGGWTDKATDVAWMRGHGGLPVLAAVTLFALLACVSALRRVPQRRRRVAPQAWVREPERSAVQRRV